MHVGWPSSSARVNAAPLEIYVARACIAGGKVGITKTPASITFMATAAPLRGCVKHESRAAKGARRAKGCSRRSDIERSLISGIGRSLVFLAARQDKEA